jgi:DnaJ-class molecular chaperone
MPRDYYDILEITRTAAPEAIKKAYRRLAKRYHPDVNKDTDASSRFREVQEAYDVLSDPKKRKLYDQFGHAGVQAGATEGAGDPFGTHSHHTNAGPGGFSFRFDQGGDAGQFGDLFEQMFGGQRRGFGGPRGGRSAGFGGMGGMGGGGGGGPLKGEDLEHTITVPFDVAAGGGTITMQLSGPGGSQTIDVKIPKAVAEGARLRVRGKGHPSATGGATGDLILTVKIAEHPYFRREGIDLYVDVPISIDEAVFGATVEVPTLDGKAKLKVPPGTGGGRKLRLRGAGLESTKGAKGDLYAVLHIDVPAKLTDEQRAALESLRGQLPDPRRDVKW